MMKKVWSVYFGFIYVVLFLLTVSVSGYTRNVIKQLSNADGLSNNSVNCIFEDSEQVLWIGTWDGLNAYNGRDFTTYRYNRNNSNSISNNVIRQILEQDQDYLWVATDYGVNRFNRKNKTFTSYFPGTETNMPKQERSFILAITSERKVLCYVKDMGVFLFDDEQQTFKLLENSNMEGIRNFVTDHQDRLVFLFENGKLAQSQILGQTLKKSRSWYTEEGDPVSDIFFSNGKLITVFPGYLKVWDDRNSHPSAIDTDRSKTISQVICTGDHLYWCFYEGGCVSYDLKTKSYTTIGNIPGRVSFFSLYLGTQNILWIGTDGQGLFQVYEYNAPFKTLNCDFPVRSFCQDDQGNILVGTKGDGIKLLDKPTGLLSGFQYLNTGLISNSVYVIRRNEAGDIFIGTEGAGVNILYSGNKRSEKLNIPDQYPFFRAVYSIHFTNHDSVLWLGTSGYGLIRIALRKSSGAYRVDDVIQYVSSGGDHALSNNVIYSVTDGFEPDELWLGTRGGGINKFHIRKELFEQVGHLSGALSLTNPDILSLLRSDSSLWIGTSYGLNKLTFSDDVFYNKEYTEDEGLPNNTIHGILEDENGSIWVSTNRGIAHLMPEQNRVENYSSKDGLQNNEFSDGAYFKDKDSVLYFGGVNGFSYFRPDEIHLRSFDPEISLSGLKIYNTAQNIRERIVNDVLKLSYNEPFVSFLFIARDFINNENCEYDYRLINFSDEWIHNGNNPNIVFTKLPPGEYRLEVKCTNSDRVWGNNRYALQIDVAYPWWFSRTALIIYLLLASLILYITQAVIRNRLRLNRQLLLEHIEKQNQQKIHESKLNFFTNVAHEFFTPLTLIYGPAEHLLEKVNLDNYTKRYVQIIKNNADRMQKLIAELMEFRKAESGHTPLVREHIDIKLLIDYISDNYTEIIQENKIDYQIFTHYLKGIVTDRNSLEKILFNLISNAFKYTPDNGYIHLDISQDNTRNNQLNISIKNSGKGMTDKQLSQVFDQFMIYETSKIANSKSTGIGLSLTKSLVELLGGQISVASVPGEYVEFKVSIPPLEKGAVMLSDDLSQTDDVQVFSHRKPVLDGNKKIRILIVEDEKNIRELLRDILAPYYGVLEAENGLEALQMIGVNRPDMMITDILMPGLDGIGLIDRLKSDPDTAHIPIISISAKSSVEDHISAYQHGADLYITKPFHPRHVLTAIENLISKHAALKEYFNSSRSSVTVKDGVTIHHDDEQLLQDIIAFVEKNIDDESLNPNAISDFLGISKATFYRKLKELTGKVPSEYVRLIRLNYASKLLVTTKMTVSEVMFKSGFMNKSYFYREFAKQFGVPPGDYRNLRTE